MCAQSSSQPDVEVNQLQTEIARLQHALAKAEAHAQELKRDKALLLKDVFIKDAYIAELRQPRAAENRDERSRGIDGRTGETNDQLHAEIAILQRALAESRAEVEGYQRTLALLRYRIADWLNGLARGAGPAHRGAKSVLARWFGDGRA